MSKIVRFADLYPSAAPVGEGPSHCQDCGASISEDQAMRTLIADWCWCPDCYRALMAKAGKDTEPTP